MDMKKEEALKKSLVNGNHGNIGWLFSISHHFS